MPRKAKRHSRSGAGRPIEPRSEPVSPAFARAHDRRLHPMHTAFGTRSLEHDARELDVHYLVGHVSADMVRRYSATYLGARGAPPRDVLPSQTPLGSHAEL